MESLLNVIVQVSTSESSGKGFVLSEYGIIVTNQHLVEGVPEVVVSASHAEPVLAKVIFTDEVYDLAFVELPKDYKVSEVKLATEERLEEHTIVATYTNERLSGKVTKSVHPFFGIDYIQTDIRIDTDYSGSLLWNENHEVVGMISGLLEDTNQKVSYTLPSKYILKAITDFKNANDVSATRCRNCETVVTTQSITGGNCPNCKEAVELPHELAEYQVQGVGRTIEALIAEIGHQPILTRRGPNHWALKQGSATIYLSYYEPRGYIMGDAFLCQLPEDGNIDAIYEYLLRQNYQIKGLTFSINQKDIVLSLIIYDRHLNTDTAKELVQKLLEQADYYDNILVEKFGGVWKV